MICDACKSKNHEECVDKTTEHDYPSCDCQHRKGIEKVKVE